MELCRLHRHSYENPSQLAGALCDSHATRRARACATSFRLAPTYKRARISNSRDTLGSPPSSFATRDWLEPSCLARAVWVRPAASRRSRKLRLRARRISTKAASWSVSLRNPAASPTAHPAASSRFRFFASVRSLLSSQSVMTVRMACPCSGPSSRLASTRSWRKGRHRPSLLRERVLWTHGWGATTSPRPQQSRDRHSALRLREHRKDPPLPRLRQARSRAPHPGRAARQRTRPAALIASPKSTISVPLPQNHPKG